MTAPPTGRLWIGVDLGTGGARAVALDDDGTRVAAARRPLHSTRWTGPDGSTRHEQDPASWTTATAGALRELTAALDPGAVGGIAVDATSGTVVLADASGFATPGVMYDDARGADRVDEVRDAGAAVWKRLGHRVGASWALPTLLALGPTRDQQVLHQTDVVTRWLAGTPVPTDASSALKTGYDADRGAWPTDVLDALGLDPALLPPVVPPGTTIGTVGADAAADTGLRAGTPIVAGMTDGCAAQLGTGAVEPGQWNAVLGTTLVLKGVTVDLLHDPAGAVYSHRAPHGPDGGWWLPGGASSVGAGVLALVVDPARFDEFTARAPEVSPPVVYPLGGRGERFPLAAPDAEGFWLDDDRTRPLEELVPAVGEAAAFAGICEGVAFVERLGLDHLADLGADVSGRRTASGGATRNRWWTGRRASVQGAALAVPSTVGWEGAAGMALLAAAAADGDVVGAAARMVHEADVVEPVADPALDERYDRFVRAVTAQGWR